MEISNKSSKLIFTETSENEKIPIFSCNDTIVLLVKFAQREIKDFEFSDIRLFFIGEIYNKVTDLKTHFLQVESVLATESKIHQERVFQIPFKDINTVYESFDGKIFSVKYYFKLVVMGSFLNIEKIYYKNILIKNISKKPIIIGNFREEIGIPGKVHLEVELFKDKFSLNDILTGGIYFLEIFCKINTIEMQIIRKERIGEENDLIEDKFIIGRLEVCDGQPYKGDYIPFRFYLKHFNIGPTIDFWGGGIQINYFLNLIIVLDTGKRLYKTQEISIWRNEYN